MIRKPKQFKNIRYSVVKYLMVASIYGLLALLGFLIFSPFGYYFFNDAYIINDIANTVTMFIYTLIFYLMAVEVGELVSRGKVELSDPYSDYEMFYKLNRIPVIGKCILCGRAIPLVYGIKPRHRTMLPKLNNLSICFHVDEDHVKYLQEYSADDLAFEEAFNEFNNLYLTIKRWQRKYYYSYLLMIIWIIINSIEWGLSIYLNYEWYYFWSIYGIFTVGATLLIWLVLIPITRISRKKHLILIKRLYLDGEDFGCYYTAMSGNEYVRIGQPKGEGLHGIPGMINGLVNKKELRKHYKKKSLKALKTTIGEIW